MTISKAAAIGGGVIGAGWVARLVLNGIDVSIYDPDPEASRKVGEVMKGARRAYKLMLPKGLPAEGKVTYAKTIAEAVTGADFIQESVPERLDLKHRVLAEIDKHAAKDALIGSSTSGIKPTDMATPMKRPERLVVGHPFNPVYLLPLVEIVGGEKTSKKAVARAREVYASIGMKPVVIRKEIEAFVGDRLLEAAWREALWLVKDGITTVEELDDIMRYSFGLRWAQMGMFQVYRIAGGEAGMRHFMAQFGPALKWPWTKLMDVPEFNDELVDLIAEQSDEQAGDLSIRELERIRDDNLVAIMDALSKQNRGKGWGAGALHKDYVKQLTKLASKKKAAVGKTAKPAKAKAAPKAKPKKKAEAMDFGLSEEQKLIVETTRAFVENELYPHEQEVERTGHLRLELIKELQAKAIAAGLYAANMPEEVGGAGLDTLTWLLYEKELGKANYALHWTCVARPSNILLAGTSEQREKYLFPCIRGEKWDCLAMTEPGAGSDLRGMKATAIQDDDDWVLNGTKHFISDADIADFAIVFMASGEEDSPRGKRKKITAFFVDKGTEGFTVRDGYRNVSHRGYTNAILEFDDCRLPKSQVLGEVHKGFEVANSWLGATRLQVAATCLGRAERALGHAISYAAQREQFGQQIGKFQGVSFKLADMATELKAANLMTMEAGWKYDQGTVTDEDMAMAKLKATEVLAYIADEAIQIHGGMGLMDDLPLERIWRDARVERIWEGTSEIQRHIISRALLRAVGG